MFILGIWIFLGALPWFLPAVPPRKSGRENTQGKAIDPAVILDLASAGLAGGAAIPRVLSALATACREPRLAAVSRALILGASKDQRARQAAQKLSVRLVIPLGICQLPAFILLGIVPVILAALENL